MERLKQKFKGIPVSLIIMWVFLFFAFLVFALFYFLTDYPELWAKTIQWVSYVMGAASLLILVSSAVLYGGEWRPS